MTYPDVFMAYQGAKRRMRSVIMPLMPDRMDRFIEPFMGGGSVTLAAAGRAERVLACDIDKRVIGIHRAVRDAPTALCKFLKGYFDDADCIFADDPNIADGHDRALFLATSKPSSHVIQEAARHIANKRVTFGGILDGSFGYTRYGQRSNRIYVGLLESRIHLASTAYSFCDFRVQDWQETLAMARSDDFIYLDPPYWGSAATVYDHSELDHEALRDALAYEKANWLLSYNDVPQVRALYAGYYMQAPTTHSYSWRAGHQETNGRIANELLIANYPMKRQLDLFAQ